MKLRMIAAGDAPTDGWRGPGQPAIEARGLTKTYPGGVRALDGLSFSVEAGTIFGLLGPNGAGKSTVVRILTTLTRPDAGVARVAGIDVRRDPERERAAIGVVGQKSGVDREATGRENLTLQGRLYGLYRGDLGRRVAGLLERFGLDEAAGPGPDAGLDATRRSLQSGELGGGWGPCRAGGRWRLGAGPFAGELLARPCHRLLSGVTPGVRCLSAVKVMIWGVFVVREALGNIAAARDMDRPPPVEGCRSESQADAGPRPASRGPGGVVSLYVRLWL